MSISTTNDTWSTLDKDWSVGDNGLVVLDEADDGLSCGIIDNVTEVEADAVLSSWGVAVQSTGNYNVNLLTNNVTVTVLKNFKLSV